MVKKPEKLPTFDPEHDGNYFHWIVQMSAMIRRNNINGQGGNNKPVRIDTLTGRPLIKRS